MYKKINTDFDEPVYDVEAATKTARILSNWDGKAEVRFVQNGYLYVVTTKPISSDSVYSVSIKGYRIVSDEPDKETIESAVYPSKQDCNVTVKDVEQAEYDCELVAKWHGCSDLRIQESHNWLHFCSEQQVIRFRWFLTTAQIVVKVCFSKQND